MAYNFSMFLSVLYVYNTLKAAYSVVFFILFKTFDKSVIKQCQFYCGCLPLGYVIDKRRISFLSNLQSVPNMNVALLFKIFGKCELEKLLIKRNMTGVSRGLYNRIMWSNFANDCFLT